MMRDDLAGYVKVAALFVAGVILLIFASWAACEAPCSWYRGAKLADTPTRCLKELAP